MASSSYLPGAQRGARSHRTRISNPLPFYSSSSAVQEKYAAHNSSWFITIGMPIPMLSRRLRLFFINPRRMYDYTRMRLGRRRGAFIFGLGLVLLFFVLLSMGRRASSHAVDWIQPLIGKPPTLVFKREDIQRIWRWEVTSGHFPSRAKIPEQVMLTNPLNNPALPPRRPPPSNASPYSTYTLGTGQKRIYLDIQSSPQKSAYPPRPVPGSAADLDIVMEHCDFSANKFVRDCLEVLRVGAGLDNGNRVRRGKLDDWKYIYVEQARENLTLVRRDFDEDDDPPLYADTPLTVLADASAPDAGLTKKRDAEWEAPPIPLRKPVEYRPASHNPSVCDTEHPRIFHMFWTGPLTDKPYLALLSFLFTQNTGLHLPKDSNEDIGCRPQFWFWINPGPAASVPNTRAKDDMMAELKANPWASPFLHPRFEGIIQFKLWNTTEQLDGVPEIRDEWRSHNLFNSGGVVYDVAKSKSREEQRASSASGTAAAKKAEDDLLNRTGSSSSSSYDRLSVILSDLARFVLCHRYGGIYLDADTLLLRDWEELWGWKGAFAYRWSRLESYNTAVLRLNKHSALGKFLFRTALKNNFDFHPRIVTRYVREAHLEKLLLRLPDALFDPAWLNTENYQMSRPPQPFFTDFAYLFETPTLDAAAPQALGFEGFFRGAYSYHYHNSWWRPFDPSRNFPDLGPRFQEGETKARQILREKAAAASVSMTKTDGAIRYSDSPAAGEGDVNLDRRDLDWSTVLKRTFEAYIRGDRPNMYGEMLEW